MENLIEKLNELYETGVTVVEDDGTYFKASALSAEVEGLCCELLITANGSCNWRNIDKLRAAGFRVFPGDQDSFGWLVGCIRKNGHKAVVCYG